MQIFMRLKLKNMQYMSFFKTLNLKVITWYIFKLLNPKILETKMFDFWMFILLRIRYAKWCQPISERSTYVNTFNENSCNLAFLSEQIYMHPRFNFCSV